MNKQQQNYYKKYEHLIHERVYLSSLEMLEFEYRNSKEDLNKNVRVFIENILKEYKPRKLQFNKQLNKIKENKDYLSSFNPIELSFFNTITHNDFEKVNEERLEKFKLKVIENSLKVLKNNAREANILINENSNQALAQKISLDYIFFLCEYIIYNNISKDKDKQSLALRIKKRMIKKVDVNKENFKTIINDPLFEKYAQKLLSDKNMVEIIVAKNHDLDSSFAKIFYAGEVSRNFLKESLDNIIQKQKEETSHRK
mgnify:CR=1 FL=1